MQEKGQRALVILLPRKYIEHYYVNLRAFRCLLVFSRCLQSHTHTLTFTGIEPFCMMSYRPGNSQK